MAPDPLLLMPMCYNPRYGLTLNRDYDKDQGEGCNLRVTLIRSRIVMSNTTSQVLSQIMMVIILYGGKS